MTKYKLSLELFDEDYNRLFEEFEIVVKVPPIQSTTIDTYDIITAARDAVVQKLETMGVDASWTHG